MSHSRDRTLATGVGLVAEGVTMSLFRIFGASAAEREEDRAAEAARDSKEKLVSPESDKHQPPRFDGVAVLEAAGVGGEQRERVERTLELLRALPAETPAAIRKNIVEASLKAFDISIKAIVEAASAEVSAFDQYIAHGHKQLDALRKESEQRIAELEAEIAKIDKRLEIATADQASLDEATIAATDRVRPVLGFFAEAHSRVANDSKNSHPPSIIIDDSLTKAG